MSTGNRDRLGVIICSLSGNGGKGARRIPVQDHPDNYGIGRVRPTLLIGPLPLGFQRFDDLHSRITRPITQEFGQASDEDHCRLVSARPTEIA